MRGDHPSNTRRRSDSRKAARIATRQSLETQFASDYAKLNGGARWPRVTSKPKLIGFYPGRCISVQKPGRKHAWLIGGGWAPAFRAPVQYQSSIQKGYL